MNLAKYLDKAPASITIIGWIIFFLSFDMNEK